MPDPQQTALAFVAEGMNAALNPANLPENQYARAVNVQLIDQRPTTRRGARVLPINDLSPEADVECFQNGNFQGGMFYNPSKGQSQINFARDLSQMMVSVAGKRFQLVPKEVEADNSDVIIQEITGTTDGNPLLHLVWWYQAENYAIAQDGVTDTWIWDGFGDPELSPGYDEINEENSRLANGATVGVYAHGRIIQVVNSRQVIVGDIIHKSNLSNAENILETTEQTYWATGSYFNPPSSMGNILAGGVLPLRNTQHGHGDIMLHCEDGVFSLDINVYPRDSWVDQVLVKHVLLKTGARGPYALALYDGDQFFRSRHGLQSIRSQAGESELLGNPLHPISEEVETWLEKDYESFVRFTSLADWAVARRLLMTVSPWVEGRFRGSRGIVSLNFAPVGSVRTKRAWEGLMTFPPEIKSPIQMMNGLYNGKDRMYMVARGEDNKNRVVELTQDLKNDVLEDGTEVRISCQLITRMLTGSDLFSRDELTAGSLHFVNVEGIVDWGVWGRTEECDDWTYWRGGQICVRSEICCDGDTDENEEGICDLRDFCPKQVDLNLGEVPNKIKHSRKVQFLIRWRGVASVEGIRVTQAPGDPDKMSGRIGDPEICLDDRVACDYNDYEYSFADSRWEDDIPKCDKR